MILAICEHKNRRTNRITKAAATRFRCKDCGKSWTESTSTLGGLRIGVDRAAQVIELLCEGNSIRATSRISGVCKGTILELLLYVGQQCEHYMSENIKGVFADQIQVDEIWSYVLCKNATAKRLNYVGSCGDCYCYTAIERTTKLLVAFHVGKRN